MKQLLLSFLLIELFSSPLLAQDTKPVLAKQFTQITTIESMLGWSHMIITNSDGSQKDTLMQALSGIYGIDLRHILQNEKQILKTLKSYTDQGWKLEQVTPLSLSKGSSDGTFVTRYLLSRPD